jgi:hypothetical protein
LFTDEMTEIISNNILEPYYRLLYGNSTFS